MTKLPSQILLQTQRDQLNHDLRAHSDILNLDTHTKLKHMILHFLKYCGKIADARELESEELFNLTIVDAFIICLATANALNINLGKDWEPAALDLDSLAIEISKLQTGSNSDNYLDALSRIVRISGKMAKAIESTDHLERGNPRADLESLTVQLAFELLSIVGKGKINLEDAMKKRWHAVESKSIFIN